MNVKSLYQQNDTFTNIFRIICYITSSHSKQCTNSINFYTSIISGIYRSRSGRQHRIHRYLLTQVTKKEQNWWITFRWCYAIYSASTHTPSLHTFSLTHTIIPHPPHTHTPQLPLLPLHTPSSTPQPHTPSPLPHTPSPPLTPSSPPSHTRPLPTPTVGS